MSRTHVPTFFDELAKIGGVTDAQAQHALERYESLDRNKPTAGQVTRYAGIGAVATPLISAAGDAIAGKPVLGGGGLRGVARGAAGRAVTGALTASAIPLLRAHTDRRAEMGTLKKYLGERGVNPAHHGPPTAGQLSAPFEPVEKTARPRAGLRRAVRGLLSEVDPRVTQGAAQNGLQSAHGRLRGKEKDSGASGVTPARPFDASGYTVDLVKGAFATSAYSGGPVYPTVPQRSFQPGFRAPSLQRAVQHQPQSIKTSAPKENVLGIFNRVFDWYLAGRPKIAFKLQGHTEHQGIPIAVENRKGSVRKGVGDDGKPWRTEMRWPYGYIKGTKGADGEEVDCYVGPVKNAPEAFVVHQRKEDGTGYDEDKVMLGFASKEDAEKAFLAHYDSPKFLGPVKALSVEKLRELIAKKKQLTKISAGAPTRGGFLMSSEMPGFRAPTLKSPVQPSQGPIVEKFAGAPTTPAGVLASAKRVGAPRISAAPGPSIAQVAKPVGFGKPAPGAVKNSL